MVIGQNSADTGVQDAPVRTAERREAIVAARKVVAAMPADRRAELNARFDRATDRARFHAEYRRPV